MTHARPPQPRTWRGAWAGVWAALRAWLGTAVTIAVGIVGGVLAVRAGISVGMTAEFLGGVGLGVFLGGGVVYLLWATAARRR